MKNYMTLVVILCLLLSGCSFEFSLSDNKKVDSEGLTYEEKQEAILQFVNEQTKNTSDLEADAFQSLASVSGENYTDDEILYNELVNTTIPAYEKAVDDAKNIKTEVKDLENMTKQIVQATETFHEALLLEKEALEKQDEELIQQSNAKMEEYKELIEDYHAEMEKLAKEYDVDYEPTS